MKKEIPKPGVYMHMKSGNLYRVLHIAMDADDLSQVVVYEALYENKKSKIWTRKLTDFVATVLISGKEVKRFVFVRD